MNRVYISHMRTYVITGAASGIGAAVVSLIEAAGDRVLARATCTTRTSSRTWRRAAGRTMVVEAVTSRTEVVDAVIANAGRAGRRRRARVRINYFGAVATLEGLRPLLARGDAPRAAVALPRRAVLQRVDDELVGACLAGDEDRAVGIVDEAVPPLDAVTEYASTKRALARWVRANVTERRAGPAPASR